MVLFQFSHTLCVCMVYETVCGVRDVCVLFMQFVCAGGGMGVLCVGVCVVLYSYTAMCLCMQGMVSVCSCECVCLYSHVFV